MSYRLRALLKSDRYQETNGWLVHLYGIIISLVAVFAGPTWVSGILETFHGEPILCLVFLLGILPILLVPFCYAGFLLISLGKWLNSLGPKPPVTTTLTRPARLPETKGASRKRPPAGLRQPRPGELLESRSGSANGPSAVARQPQKPVTKKDARPASKQPARVRKAEPGVTATPLKQTLPKQKQAQTGARPGSTKQPSGAAHIEQRLQQLEQTIREPYTED